MESRWWEYYAVRYFVGTIVGAMLVVAIGSVELFSSYAAKVTAYKDQPFLGVGLVAALGFAFCYVTSAPILALHAIRTHFRAAVVNASVGWRAGTAAAMLVPSLAAAWWLSCSLPLLAAVTAGPAIGLPFGLVALAALSKFSAVERFARDLANKRAQAYPKQSGPAHTFGQEYVTSYRHLREHGNAFLILAFEGVLAYALMHTPSLRYAAILLALWVLPAAAVWFVGTVLESRFALNAQP